MSVRIEASWKARLEQEFEQPYWESLTSFVRDEYAALQCCPAGKNIFRAFDLTPFDDVKVVILSQDPYHTPGAAMGFCFSVPEGNRPQPSLQNIFQELHDDLGLDRRQTDLTDWAQQGVFLLNSVLTVRAREAGSHAQKRLGNLHRQRHPPPVRATRTAGVHPLGQLRDFKESLYRRAKTPGHHLAAPIAVLGAQGLLRQQTFLARERLPLRQRANADPVGLIRR